MIIKIDSCGECNLCDGGNECFHFHMLKSIDVGTKIDSDSIPSWCPLREREVQIADLTYKRMPDKEATGNELTVNIEESE